MTPSSNAVGELERRDEITIETRSRAGQTHRTVIWVVVVDGVPYIASVRGERGRWWRELTASGDGTVIAGRERVRVRAHHVRSADTKRAVSQAYARKYAGSGNSLASMRRQEVLDTTLRLELVP